MRQAATALLISALLTGSAQAQELSPAADRLLWCSSAMYWLASDAFDSGDDAEGDQYQAWSDDLGARADLLLEADGRSDAEITTIRDGYDSRVLDELGSDGAKYDVAACPDLAGP